MAVEPAGADLSPRGDRARVFWLGAAVLGELADLTSIEFVYRVCAFLPAMGLLAVFLPDISPDEARARPQSAIP